MICPNCQHENRPSARFCGKCRTKLQPACPGCGAEVVPGNPFCDECGADLLAAAGTAAPSQPPSLETQFTSFQRDLPPSFREQLLTGVASPATAPSGWAAEGENRLVTVLFADMSSSVRTTADLHPEDAAALISRLLRAMVDVLLQYEGRVDRFLGDGLLAVFGAPQAHESDPERAILAAMKIRIAARQLGLEVTAGINTGQVYVGGVGSEQHQEVTVIGPVVNLASRLQAQAEPGQILVGEATYRLTRRAFAFTPLSLEVKGIAQPVAAYAVERALPRPEKVRGIEGLRAELIGRDAEFAKLRDALAEALRGRGQMVTLIGEAGVGKSRLIAELKQALGVGRWALGSEAEDAPPPTPNAQRLTPLWLEGRCLELGMGASYWLFVDLFRQFFAFAPEEEEKARAERVVASLKELVERGALAAERLEEMGPLLGNMLSLRFGTEWDERLKNASPEQIKHQTFTAIRDFFVALGKQQPVILVCEDLHWADSLSLDVISLLMETLTLAPLLLLCVYRPERAHKCWHLGSAASRKCPERYTEIALRELTAPQSRRLVEALLTIENLPAAVKELILEKSRGNPFFVEEVVRSLIASGMVYQEAAPSSQLPAPSSDPSGREPETGSRALAEGVWKAREGIESVTVPESVQSVILSRVDRLERKLRSVLESASVIGRLFRRRLLQYTTQGAAELEEALWALEDQALIYQERVVPEEEYSFQHVLTQETIYESILRRRRVVFHQRVAEAMETLYQEGLEEYCEQLAYHYERSGADEKAVEYLLKAGEKARRAYLNEEAIRYFQRALERLERSSFGPIRNEWRLEALKGLGQIHQGTGKVSEAEDCFRQAIAVGKEIGLAPRELVRLYYWLGDVLFWQSRGDETIRLGEEGLALLGEDTESVEAALMINTVALGYSRRGDHIKAREFFIRNARFVQRLPYSEELRSAYVCIHSTYAYADKNLAKAMEWRQELQRNAEQQHDVRALAAAHYCEANLRGSTGDLRGALAGNQEALELFTRIGDSKHRGWALGSMSWWFLSQGDLQKAEEYRCGSHEITEAVGDKSRIAFSNLSIGTVALCKGMRERASDAFQEATRLFREIQMTGLAAWAACHLGRVSLGQGERREALSRFQEAITLAGRGIDDVRFFQMMSGLEEAFGDAGEFRAFCRRFRKEHPEADDPHLVQWFLRPAKARDFPQGRVHDRFADTLSPDWSWQDPFGDCCFVVQNGLEIHAANERDLWHVNLSAPRLLRPFSGDFAAQTVCVAASEGQPAIGGLLLWHNNQNYLRLDRGTRGPYEISFQGCLGNKDLILGRGRLPSERIFLRLERRGGWVSALCSAEGEEWLAAGQVEFPDEGPVEAGLHAIGKIDRTVYPGAYPEGTAIRFERFELLG